MKAESFCRTKKLGLTQYMETNRAFYLGFVFLLLAVDCSRLNWKVNVIAKTDSDYPDSNIEDGSNEQVSVSNSVSDSNVVDKGKKYKGSQVNGSKENIDYSGKHTKNSNNNDTNNNKNNDESRQSGSQKTDNVKKDTTNWKEKSQAEGDNNLKTKAMPKDNGNQGDPGVKSKDSPVEECDPSNKCTDDENKLVACLRVPGNDRQYSLLIQNKEKQPLTVSISGPDFVQLEKTEIQLQAEGNEKVEVSITKGGSDDLIVLRAGKGHCNLDIKHLIAENSDNEFVNSQKSTYMNFMSRTCAIVVLSFAALLILAVGWTCISFRKKQLSASGSKYGRLETDLPVSGGGKAKSEHNEGWDNSWGDDWDDEEAPKTPSMPVTPSLSSKGLASRRLSKEGWKD